MGIERVGIVGGGQMGAGIAEVCAKAGVHVIVHEPNAELAAASKTRVEKSLGKAVDRGKLDAADRDATLGRMQFSSDLDLMVDRQLVIEAIVESEQAKHDVFSELDRIVADSDAILASNTSSIPLTRIGQATGRPGSVVGMHFFNPATVMPLVEIVHSVTTTDDTADRAAAFASEVLGKVVVRTKDRAGFIVNMLLCPYIFQAIRMYESGFATREDIDAAMVNGAGYPMGPLTLADLIGNDTMLAVSESLHAEYGEARYSAPPLLKRMVEAGLLGRKTGKGFYEYG